MSDADSKQMAYTHFIILRAVLVTFDPVQPPTALWKTQCSGYIHTWHAHTYVWQLA